MSGLLQRIRSVAGLDGIGYEESKAVARSADAKARRKLAARADVRPEILYFLAEDAAPEVRRQVAANQATPVQADVILARDSDGDVRRRLAEKIAKLTPDLVPDERDRIWTHTVEALEILANDQLTQVRQILSEILKDVASVPRRVIGRLARDSEIAVAQPVLQFSPLLTDEDLLEIIHGSAPAGALSAISQRAGVGTEVSDAIRQSGESAAIAALLANPSAQIREETLDRIIDDAADVPEWHPPLVARPALPKRAAVRIAQYVAHSLLQALTQRRDLDAETAAEVEAIVRYRIDVESDCHDPAERARQLHGGGMLGEETIGGAIAANDRAFVVAALALRAELPEPIVANILASHSARGVVSLVWKAGLGMRTALQLQLRIAGLSPQDMLNARDGVHFPLSEDDMEWQLELFQG